MVRRYALTALAVAAGITAGAQQQAPPGPVLPGPIGALHHRIDTAQREVQRLFDQGLTLYYGFSRDGARRSFERAAALDPGAAMPKVGIALSLGPNINVEASPAEIRAGCAAAREASSTARADVERAYAEALVTRYCGTSGGPKAAGERGPRQTPHEAL